MTEEEARTKRCPFFNEPVSCVKNNNCLAAGCMMWVWGGAFNLKDATGKGYGGKNYNTEGHCGLIK